MVWHPKFPYKSYLTGQTCQEYADAYTAETGKQWTQPLGQLGKYEWAVDVLKRVTDVDNKAMYVDMIKTTKFDGINGPVDFTLPVTRPVPSGAERLQDQDRRRPVGQIRGSEVQVRHLHLLRPGPEHAHPEEVRSHHLRLAA